MNVPSGIKAVAILSLFVSLLTAACRALGYTTGNVLSRGIQMESEDEALLSLMCREAGLDIMSCDWSEFYTGSSDCVPELDRHYITCGYGRLDLLTFLSADRFSVPSRKVLRMCPGSVSLLSIIDRNFTNNPIF